MQALQQMLVALLLAVNAYAAEPPTVYQLVDQYGPVFGVATSTLNKLANCESGGNPKAYNPTDPNGGSFGVFQYQIPTFYTFAKEYGLENPDINNTEQQVLLTAWAFSRNRQHHWTCWKRL